MSDQIKIALVGSGERADEGHVDAIVHRLGEAAGEGRLTLEEFASRLREAYAARTVTELMNVLDGLSGRLPARIEEFTDRHLSVLGGMRRGGRWLADRRLISLTALGNVHLDLRKALLAGPELTLTSIALIGGVQACVPEGVRVDVGGLTLFGRHEVDLPEPAPGAPKIRINAYSLVGGVAVAVPRGW